MTFLEFCKKNRKRDDGVGDFCEDWCTDKERPMNPNLEQIIDYLDGRACEDAINAAARTYKLYLESRKEI
jgi:hypothetical protein